jgi:hypothetical protein
MKKQKLASLLFFALFFTAVQNGAVTPTLAEEKHEGHDHETESKKHEGHDHAAEGKKHKHDHSKEGANEHAKHHPKAANGGVVLEIDEYHGELVLNDGKIKLFLSDHDGKDVATKGFTAIAMILSAQGKQGPLKLLSVDEKYLQSSDSISNVNGARVIITLTDPHGHSSQVRYKMP